MPSRTPSPRPKASKARRAPSTSTPTATRKSPSSSFKSRAGSSPTARPSRAAEGEEPMLGAVSGALLTGLAQGAMIALVALGYTMVYGVFKLINFAHSEAFMMGAYAGFFFMNMLGGAEHPVAAAVFGTLAAMTGASALGILVERVAYRPLRQRLAEIGRASCRERVQMWSG